MMQAIKLEIPARYEDGERFKTIANVYMLDPPYMREEYDWELDDDKVVVHRFVIASDNSKDEFLNTIPGFTPETLLFACDSVGHINNWGGIGGGYTHTHESAFAEIGYEIVT